MPDKGRRLWRCDLNDVHVFNVAGRELGVDVAEGALDGQLIVRLAAAASEVSTWKPMPEDRDALVARLAQAYNGERYIGDLTTDEWTRWYRVVDAIYGATDA